MTHMKDMLDLATSDGGLAFKDVVALLSLDSESKEVEPLLEAGREASRLWTAGRGHVWASIGIDRAPCPMSCSFCSLGAKWGIVRDRWALGLEEIVERVRGYDVPGVRWISIRTTEDYSSGELVRIARLSGPLHHAELVVNTGEFSGETALALHEAGFRMAYHVMRLREGLDTGIDVARRLETLKAIEASPLELSALVDPVGPEHSNAEIAESILMHRALGATLMGVMARFPVPGTPKFDLGAVTPARLAQITAVVRLAAGPRVPAICTHPTDERILRSGANTVVTECGAIPRDTVLSEREWRGFHVENAIDLLRGAGHLIQDSPTGGRLS